MYINDRAPVKATREVRILSDAETVWRVLMDIDDWPAWNKAVSRAHLEGPVAPGTIFRWKSKGSSIVSTLGEVDPPRKVGWTGQTLGTEAVHVWQITPVEAGVVVRTSESFDGWLVRHLQRMFQRMLEQALEETLDALKKACDSRPRT